ncbi:hypothetical protein ACFL5X_02395 [Candidatus Omnitrophota bacterium]
MPLKYSLNKDNQLTVKAPGLTKPKTLTGSFQTDHNNNLIYLVNEPSGWHKDFNIPSRLKFTGKWKFTDKHDLALEVTKQKSHAKTSLVLTADIIKPEKESLLFRVRTKPSRTATEISLLTLRGAWRQDKLNRLVFDISHSQSTGSLTFKNTWKLDKNHQIIYTYQSLQTKQKNTIRFEGSWRLTAKNKLGYILETISSSRTYKRKKSATDLDFNFRVHLQTPTIYPQAKAIKYRIGIGTRLKRKEQTLTLYGAWKFSRTLGLTFAIDYGKGRVEEAGFSFGFNLSKQDRVIVGLKSKGGQPLGINLVFTRKFLAKKAFEYFLRLRLTGKKPSFDLGGTLKF